MSAPTQVMLDLETLGQAPGCVILAIGAVKFAGGEITASFYERVDPASCVNFGMKLDVDTVMWWMAQSDAARSEIVRAGKTIDLVLRLFSEWLNDAGAEVWGNGAGFDNVILADVYDRVKILRPWRWWNDRCYRTACALLPPTPKPLFGTNHNALCDAKSQALHLMAMLATRYSLPATDQ